MILKIKFADNSIKLIKLLDNHGKIEKIAILQKKKPKPKPGLTWAGLWVTDTNLFVEVLDSEEAYTLNSKGGRMVFCKIGKDGDLFIDRAMSCRLIEKQRGDESRVKSTGAEWPILRRD